MAKRKESVSFGRYAGMSAVGAVLLFVFLYAIRDLLGFTISSLQGAFLWFVALFLGCALVIGAAMVIIKGRLLGMKLW